MHAKRILWLTNLLSVLTNNALSADRQCLLDWVRRGHNCVMKILTLAEIAMRLSWYDHAVVRGRGKMMDFCFFHATCRCISPCIQNQSVIRAVRQLKRPINVTRQAPSRKFQCHSSAASDKKRKSPETFSQIHQTSDDQRNEIHRLHQNKWELITRKIYGRVVRDSLSRLLSFAWQMSLVFRWLKKLSTRHFFLTRGDESREPFLTAESVIARIVIFFVIK